MRVAIFVTIGNALPKAGPAGLFVGFFIWAICILCVNECYGYCLRLLAYVNNAN